MPESSRSRRLLTSTAAKVDATSEAVRVKEAYARRPQSAGDNRYSFLNVSHLHRIQEIERRILRILKRTRCADLKQKRILEIGCGTGFWLREFIRWGAEPHHLFGVDLLEDRINRAKQLCPPGVQLRVADASRLLPCTEFDIVCQMTVFTSILDSGVKEEIARQILRVLKPDGVILWYDFFVNNPRNKDVRGIRRKEILALFPRCRVHLERLTVAPPFARVLSRISPMGYDLASALKVFSTHYLGTIQNQ